MSKRNDGFSFSRREFIGVGAATLAAASASELLTACARAPLAGTSGAAGAGGIGYFARFGVDEALIRSAIAAGLSRGGDHAELFFQHRVSDYVGLEDGEVNRASTSVELGVGVRVLKGDQTGYAYTEELTGEAVRRAAQTAAAIADGPGREAPAAFRVEGKLPQRYAAKIHWEDVRPAQKLPILSGLNQQSFAKDPRIKKVSCALGNEAAVVLIADSRGRLVEDVQPMTDLRLSCVAEQNGRRESGWSSRAARAGFEFYTPELLAEVLEEATRRTLILFEAVPAPVGEMPVVLGSGSCGVLLHEAIGHGMEADFNRKGISIYADRMGKPIAKDFVTIVDDGSLEYGRGTLNVDDEGHVAGRTVLVEKGVLTTYMHDLISSQHYRVDPTGNGRRQSYAFPPVPRMRATYMLNGPHKKEEILASVKKGIYCETIGNGQVQIGAGDFSFYLVNGWLIEDGKLTRPIKDVNLIGNGPKVLEKIDLVADDLKVEDSAGYCGKDGQRVPVSFGMPTVRVSAITVGGRKAS
ncbi:MAG: TldD/PmbA family protein [Deltaproteobacteria bacterium]|nr:TldD/PmbA family protein [Deltaproteobacteria bacterium]